MLYTDCLIIIYALQSGISQKEG